MISERIRQARKETKLSQEMLGKRVGVTKSTVSQWESGTTEPKGENLLKLADALNVSASWLLGRIPSQQARDENAKLEGVLSPWDSGTPLENDEVEVPFYKEIQLAAGSGSFVDVDHNGNKLRFARSTLRKAGVEPECAACVSIIGGSMEPVLADGAVVGVDTAQTAVKDGKMYAIDHDGLLRVKLLYRIPGGIRVRSYNRAEYDDEEYTGAAASSIKVIGRVFWYSVLL